MEAYFTVNDPYDDFALLETDARRQRYEAWSRYQAKPDEDLAMVARRFAAASGVSDKTAVATLMALGRLMGELPLLRALQDKLCHLDFNRLIAIDRALDKADMTDEATAAYLDAAVTAFLTPKSMRQELPTARAITRHIDEIITRLDDTVASDEEMPEESVEDFGLEVLNSRAVKVAATLDPATADIVESAIYAAAHEHGISPAKAFVMLTTGEINPVSRVTLNVYSSPANDGLVFVPGTGWVKLEDLGVPVDHRDMDAAAVRVADSYVTPVDIAQFVEGRDGECRYPGCNKPAQDCQKDHRINHADGGPTCAANLASLCQHHHNIKTDQRAFYIMDPITGIVYWLFADGSWQVDHPVGPLAPDKAHWLTTLGQSAQNRRAAKRQLAQDVKAARRAMEEAEASFADEEPEVGVIKI